jgi:hypothetical protein
MNTEPYCELYISRTKLTRCLIAAVAALLVAHVTLQVWHYRWHEMPRLLLWFFDVDKEDSLPTWYSTITLMLASILLLLVARRKQAGRDPWFRYWYGLSLTFAALSMDEAAGVHETLNTALDITWEIVGGIVAAWFGLAYLGFLRHLPARTGWLFVASGCVFVGGAVGVEWSTDWYEERELLDTLAYNLWNAVEEGLEMAGVVLFIYALLGYMGQGQRTRVDVVVAE